MVGNRNNSNARANKIFNLKQSGKWNPSGKKSGGGSKKVDGYDIPTTESGSVDYSKIKVGSRLFKSLGADGKKMVRKSHGLPGGYTPQSGSSGGSGIDDLTTKYTEKEISTQKKPTKKNSKFKVGKIYKQNGKKYKYTEDGNFKPLETKKI
jgi:hypothetical protein